MSSHRELLQQAEDLYQAELNKVAQLENQLEVANAKIVVLETTIEELKKLLEEETDPNAGYLLRETFQKPLDPAKFIFLCHDPALNFKWIEPGALDVIFIAGKTTGSAVSSSSGKVLRTELEWRKAGTADESEIAETIPTGAAYECVADFTIPSNYTPAVSDKPNEKRNLFQLWEASTVAPFALELIRPALAPWDGKTDILRVVAAGAVRWTQTVVPGTRYRVKINVKLSKADGRMTIQANDAPPWDYIGPTCFGVASAMVPHFGLYLPGSDNDPKDSTTVIRFHEVSIK